MPAHAESRKLDEQRSASFAKPVQALSFAPSLPFKNHFFDSIQADVRSLMIYAGIHEVADGFHRMLVRRFPFAIYDLIQDDVVGIYAVLDCRRDPDWIVDCAGRRSVVRNAGLQRAYPNTRGCGRSPDRAAGVRIGSKNLAASWPIAEKLSLFSSLSDVFPRSGNYYCRCDLPLTLSCASLRSKATG